MYFPGLFRCCTTATGVSPCEHWFTFLLFHIFLFFYMHVLPVLYSKWQTLIPFFSRTTSNITTSVFYIELCALTLWQLFRMCLFMWIYFVCLNVGSKRSDICPLIKYKVAPHPSSLPNFQITLFIYHWQTNIVIYLLKRFEKKIW